MGALLLTIRPVVAQTEGCADTGPGTDRKGVCFFSHDENDASQVGRLTTREHDQRQVVKVWELVEDTDFPDHDDFRIDRKSGVLSFKSLPNYENPRSSASTGTLADRNVYKVKAKLGDGEKFVYTEVTVRVAGVEEAETLTLSARLPEVGEQLMATLAGGDIRGLRTPDWQWQVEDGSGGWADIPNAVNRGYTPRAASDDYDGDVGKKLRAYVSYQDSHDNDTTRLGESQFIIGTGVTEFPVRAAQTPSVAPMFRDNDEVADAPGTASTIGVQTTRWIEENSPPGMYVGPPVFATDNDIWRLDASLSAQVAPPVEPGGPRDVLTYSLTDITDAEDTTENVTAFSGNAALFSIDQATGQIMTKAPVDRESLNRDGVEEEVGAIDYMYRFLAIATDPSGETGQATVTIRVLDVDEAPEVTGPAALTYFENTPVSDTDSAPELRLDQDHAETATGVQEAVYIATDNDLDDDGTLNVADRDIEWELRGDDASKFQFVGSTDTHTNSNLVTSFDSTAAPPTVGSGTSPALQFRSPPDLENAGDKDKNNVYEIEVVAWDGDWEIGSRLVTIRVANADDVGTITLSHIQPQQGTAITATLNDPDGVSGTIKWQWYTGADTTTAIDDATSNTFTPPSDAAEPGSSGRLHVRAEYTDNGGTVYRDATGDTPDAGPDNRPSATTSTDNTVRAAAAHSNQAPKFYADGVAVGDDTDTAEVANRTVQNEVATYTRYVLENQTRNVALSEEDARVYDSDTTTSAIEIPVDGVVNAFDTRDVTLETPPEDTPTADGTNGNQYLHYSLSGADAKYFEIPQADDGDATPAETRGVIKTKGPLDFEAKRTYTVIVTATDPAGLTDKVTVTIHVVDVPEIEQVESRKRVPENTRKVMDLSTHLKGDVSKGGWKWSLLTTTAELGLEPQETTPAAQHNRNDPRSIDCHWDETNEDLCDDFLVSPFNGATTELQFAIGTGETHDTPNFEMPSDRARDIIGSPGNEDYQPAETIDNVYKIVVRVAFANLRSQQPGDDQFAAHPHPRDDEKQDFEIWIRVDDVDEAPSFADDVSNRLTPENSDDLLPAIVINRSVIGTVEASDPEYKYEDGPQYGKKLVYSLDAGDYSSLFQIVPSTGEILTRARLDYESLTELTEMGPDGGQHRIITGPMVTATDSAMPMGNSDDIAANIRVNDVNETPIPTETLTISGDAAPDYAEGQEDTTVGTYTASGSNAAAADWSLGGDDRGQFELEGTGSSRMLKFASARDYEMAADADGDNVYMVSITATHDADDNDTMDVAVTVTNVEEDGTVTLKPMNPSVGTEITATLEDPDVVDESTVMWQWASSSASDGTFTDISGADSATYTPDAGDAGLFLRARADYEDGEGSGKYAMMVSDSAVTQVAVNGDSAVTVAENTTAVGTYTASGADSFAWTVSGDDASAFSVSGGVLSFSSAPNYEAAGDADTDNVYMVTVVAKAGDAMDSQDVAVTVTNVDEPGSVTGLPATAMVGAELTAMLVDDDTGVANTTWQWSRAGTDIADATSASYTVAADDAGMSLQVMATYDDVHGTGKTASATVMVMADVVGRYDGNGDGEISIPELLGAIDAYFDGVINLDDLGEVIDAYFNG